MKSCDTFAKTCKGEAPKCNFPNFKGRWSSHGTQQYFLPRVTWLIYHGITTKLW